MKKTRLSVVNFIEKIWSKSFHNGIVHNKVEFYCICTTIFWQYTQLFYKVFTAATESGRSMGGCNFRNLLPINVPKYQGGKGHVFRFENFNVVRFLLSGTWSLPFHYGYCWSHDHSHSRRYNHNKNCTTMRMSRRTQKVEIYHANGGCGLAYLSTYLGHFLGGNVGNEFGLMLRAKRPHKPKFVHEIVLIHSLII